MVKGQLSIVNYQLSIKKNSAYPVDKQGSVFLFSQIYNTLQKGSLLFLDQ